MPETCAPHASDGCGLDDVMGAMGVHLGVDDIGKSLANLVAVMVEDLWDEGGFP